MNTNCKEPDKIEAIDLTSIARDSSVLSALMARLSNQTRKGIEKYGSAVQATDLTPRQWIEHLQDEMVDSLVYLECLKQSMPDAAGTYLSGNELRRTSDDIIHEQRRTLHDAYYGIDSCIGEPFRGTV